MRRPPPRARPAWGGAGGLVLACVVQLTTGQVANSAPAPAGAPQSVIVVLADQLADAPPRNADSSHRHSRATPTQDAVLGRLAGAKPAKVKHFTLGNAFSATVTPAQAEALRNDPAVASVV